MYKCTEMICNSIASASPVVSVAPHAVSKLLCDKSMTLTVACMIDAKPHEKMFDSMDIKGCLPVASQMDRCFHLCRR